MRRPVRHSVPGPGPVAIVRPPPPETLHPFPAVMAMASEFEYKAELAYTCGRWTFDMFDGGDLKARARLALDAPVCFPLLAAEVARQLQWWEP